MSLQVYIIKAHGESSTECFIGNKSAQEDGNTTQEDGKTAQQNDSTTQEDDLIAQEEADGIIKWADIKKSKKRVKPLRFRLVRRAPQKAEQSEVGEEQA